MQAIKQFVDFLFERGQNIYELEADILIRLGQRGQWGENPKIFMSLKPISLFDRDRGGLVEENPII